MKYVRRFADATAAINAKDIVTPNVSYVDDTINKVFMMDSDDGTEKPLEFVEKDGELILQEPYNGPASNEIWYTTTDNEIVTTDNDSCFGATLISNEFDSSIGYFVLKFDGPIDLLDGEMGAGDEYHGAFTYCMNLLTVYLPNGVSKIGTGTFNGCASLTNVVIPNSIKYIGNSAFGYCGGLSSITIPYGVTYINDDAFACCYALSEINIPNTITYIGDNAFYSCDSLPVIDNIRYADTCAMGVSDDSLSTYKIKDGTRFIGGYTFSGCESLSAITIPYTVISVGNDAFYYCNSLPIIDNIRYADTVAVGVIDTELTDYTIKEGTRFIGNSAFIECKSLSSITIPDSVISIGDATFQGCSSLSSITISSSVTSIGGYAFSRCTALSSITIPNSVTSVGEGAFFNCTSLSSITIPNSVTHIGDRAFFGCSALSSITIPYNITSIGDSVFNNCASLNNIRIPDSVTAIYYSAFSGCTSLSSITIPNSVNSIEDSSFNMCTSLSDFRYNGTIAEWANVGLGGDWKDNAPFTVVHCTDGDYNL